MPMTDRWCALWKAVLIYRNISREEKREQAQSIDDQIACASCRLGEPCTIDGDARHYRMRSHRILTTVTKYGQRLPTTATAANVAAGGALGGFLE
jgi:hypothetical protein